jgi:predicted O-methyltransferase YrrM
MLEIGIDFGGSTAVFLKLDSNHLRELVAIDVDDKRRRAYRLLMDDEKRCRFHTMDAYEESTVSFLSKNYEGFDIIIDDGPHTWESQRFFFENYYKLLNDGGLLVCEDVKYSYLPEVKKLRDEHDFNLFIVDLHDNTKNDANLDDMMVLRYKN